MAGSGHFDTTTARTGDATSIGNTAVGAWTLADKGDAYLDHALRNGASNKLVAQTNAAVLDAAHHVVAVVSAAANDPAGTAATLWHGGAPNATGRPPDSSHATGRPVEPRRPASSRAGAPVPPEVAQRQDAIP